MHSLSDNEIIELILNEPSANRGFKLLIEKYKQPLYWHIRRLVINHDDADDLVQEVFVKVWKNLGRFRQDAKLFTWMYRIATNEALSFLKRKKNRHLLSFSDYNQKLAGLLEDDNYFGGDEIQKKLNKAVLSLPEKQRAVFHMKYYDEMKYEEMSEVLNTSVGALKASYHFAVKKIKQMVT